MNTFKKIFFTSSTILILGITVHSVFVFGSGLDDTDTSVVESVAIFDQSTIHEISIDLSYEQYENMVNTYLNEDDKEWEKVDITIDGITLNDVGIRLKGNSTLSMILGGGHGGMPGDMQVDRPNNRPDTDFEQKIPEGEENMPFKDEKGPDGMIASSVEIAPFLIRFDKYIDGQNYQGLTEIALRVGNNDTLLSEPLAFSIHKEFGQIVPETSMASVQVGEEGTQIYVIAEHPTDEYIEKYFTGEEGYLYKAGNFIGFEYRGDDESSYDDIYEEKTEADNNLEPLIAFLKFVDESSDEEFDSQLENWLDIESFAKMIALDDLLENSDSFSSAGSNYYLFYSVEDEKFTMLSWDQNLAFGGMDRKFGEENTNEAGFNKRPNTEENTNDIAEKFPKMGNGENMDFPVGGGPMGDGPMSSENKLYDRFFESDKFSKIYDEIYTELKTQIFDEELGKNILERLSTPFIEYNSDCSLIDCSDYNTALDQLKSFFTDK